MDESEAKPTKEEGSRPQASFGLKTKKERENNEINARVSTAMFIAPPKTPVSSTRRRDAQAKPWRRRR